MHYVLFVPGFGQPRALLSRCGRLRDHVEGCYSAEVPEPHSPTGQRGTVIVWPDPDGVREVDLSTTEWVPAVPSDGRSAERYYVGWWPATPPTPAELAKPDGVRGRRVDLGDQSWVVPSLGELPIVVEPRLEGLGYVVPQHLQAYWEQAGKLRQKLDHATEGGEIELDQVFGLVVESLNLNYRLPQELAGALGLLTIGDAGSLRAATYAALWDRPESISSIRVDRLRPGVTDVE